MKKVICVIMILSFSTTLFAQQKGKSPEFENGYLDGKVAAGKEFEAGGWFAAGLGGGLLLGLIGTGIVAGLSQAGTVEPGGFRSRAGSMGQTDYKMGFFKGYSRKAKNKRLQKSLIGGAIGTVIIVAVIVSTQGTD